MQSGRARILVIGSIMIDRVVRVGAIPRPGETVAAVSSDTFPGGKGANQAAAAAKCGASVRMLGRTGRDGHFIIDALRDAGVDARRIVRDDPMPGAATVMVSESGENAIVIAPGANRSIAPADIERFLADARPGDLVLFQNECSALHEGIAIAALRGCRVWLNAAPADAALRGLRMEKLAGLVVNEIEAEALTGESDPRYALEVLASRMPGGTVIVTLGAAGAIAAAGQARFSHRGFVVDAVDTVGCGDAFVGAFLAAISGERTITEALSRANAAGALAATVPGAMPSLPTRDEVDAAAIRPEGSRLERRTSTVLGGKPERCESCGYGLAANELGDACPECGRVISPARFAGRWADRRARRRFGIYAWFFAFAALLLLLAVGSLVITEAGLLGRRGQGWMRWLEVSIGGAVVCAQVLLPIAMVLVLRSASRIRPWTVGEVAALVRLAGLAVLAGWVVLAQPRDWMAYAWFVLLTLSDALFVRELARLGERSAVQGVPLWRLRVLAAVAVVSVTMWLMEDFRPPLPTVKFSWTTGVSCFIAVELVLFARRVRAVERA